MWKKIRRFRIPENMWWVRNIYQEKEKQILGTNLPLCNWKKEATKKVIIIIIIMYLLDNLPSPILWLKKLSQNAKSTKHNVDSSLDDSIEMHWSHIQDVCLSIYFDCEVDLCGFRKNYFKINFASHFAQRSSSQFTPARIHCTIGLKI